MIKFLDLQKINKQYSEELKKVAGEVIDSGWYLLGDRVKMFEKHLSDFIGTKHIISCANGLDALRLILRAYKELGIMKDGDEVIVPANTYIASILAITDNNLVPVFTEPDEQTFNLDLSLIERQITSKTRAIMPVHLYGRICWNNEIDALASKYDLKIIEDNAQAIGARWSDGRMSGNLGHAGGLSFYPGKNLGALGDSGAVATNDDEIASIVRSVANYGSSRKYINEYQGLNSRMDEIQAAFLDVKLNYLLQENEIRRTVAELYINSVTNPKILLPFLPEKKESHVWHLFVVRTADRDDLQGYLTKKNIQTLIHYPIPPHKQKCYSQYNILELPLTEKLANEVLSLPISSVTGKMDVENIIEALNSW